MAWFNSTAVGEDLCSWNVIIARRVGTPIVRRRNSNVESIKTKLDETTEFHDGRALLFFQTFPPVWILMPPFQHLYQTSGTYRAPFLLLHLLKSIIHHIRIYLQHPSLLLRQKM